MFSWEDWLTRSYNFSHSGVFIGPLQNLNAWSLCHLPLQRWTTPWKQPTDTTQAEAFGKPCASWDAPTPLRNNSYIITVTGDGDLGCLTTNRIHTPLSILNTRRHEDPSDGTSMSSPLLTHPPPPTIATSASCFWWKHVIWASLQLTSRITKYCAQLPFILGRRQEIGWRKHPNTQNMFLGCFRRYVWRVQLHSAGGVWMSRQLIPLNLVWKRYVLANMPW